METNDGFDGSAQGYGYKTPQAVYKAYAYFKSKDQRKAEVNQVKKFLKDNPDVKAALKNYLDADWAMDRAMDGFAHDLRQANLLTQVGAFSP